MTGISVLPPKQVLAENAGTVLKKRRREPFALKNEMQQPYLELTNIMRDLQFLISRSMLSTADASNTLWSPRLSNALFVSTLSDAKR
jgi:hypothetical protein